MKIFHRNAADVQRKKFSNFPIPEAKAEPVEIANITTQEKTALTAIAVYYVPGFENISVSFKIISTKEFYFIDNLPLHAVGNVLGDTSNKEKKIWDATHILETIVIDQTKKIEIWAKPTIPIPANSILIITDSYKVIG